VRLDLVGSFCIGFTEDHFERKKYVIKMRYFQHHQIDLESALSVIHDEANPGQ
jgi:hypothetical protein